MDPRYQEFCLSDHEFYDQLSSDISESDHLSVHSSPLPSGWERRRRGAWITCLPSTTTLPAQGWKVHVSAAVANADSVASRVWDYCTTHRIAFKLVPDLREYMLKNSKYADRAGSGKLATLYPVGEAELLRVLDGLGAMLDGEQGPYILSDLRWKDGPLYVRYGSFLERKYVDANGVVQSGLETPSGSLEPDPRGPVFRIPDWVSPPPFLQPELERRAELKVDEFPYEIVRAVHFSNGGGVYEGKHRASGRRLIIKEARPYAGLDAGGRDAVARLRNERDVLERLRGLACVPELVDYCRFGENEFLVEGFVDAIPLNQFYAQRNPICGAVQARGRFAEYGRWAQRVWDAVSTALRAVHKRGIVFGDLHPFNVMVVEEGADIRAVLVDFEVSWPVDTPRRHSLEHPGFGAPADRQGFEADAYALAALQLALYVPLTTLIRLDRRKAEHLADLIADTFSIDRRLFDDAVATLGEAGGNGEEAGGNGEKAANGRRSRRLPSPRIEADPSQWAELRDSLASAVHASASPGRTDRLFPGDIGQFTAGGGLSLAHGAAGVLWALRASGASRYEEGEEWLVRRAQDRTEPIPPGFYNGLHGMAYVLWELGRQEEAVQLLARASGAGTEGAGTEGLGSSLFSGLSGIGLNCLAFAERTGEPTYREQAEHLADLVGSRVVAAGELPEVSGGSTRARAGLMHGSSGAAVFLTAMFEASGRETYRAAARIALEQDLRRCVTDTVGVLHVNEGWRTVPYLSTGSVGVGFALRRYLRSTPDPALQDMLRGAERAASSDFYVFSGLFDGRCGPLLFHATRHGDQLPLEDDSVVRQMLGLNWHTLRRHDAVAFPGDQLLRLSMDLASGSAGVLLALAAAHGVRRAGKPACLPFL
ncbi:class III lanthionine synthetase LanKC [Streptomyces sp. NPDC059743]|uniref:class III lanthionine synthetase LanKC n=1 Tax=Streptomyces sp. NPDC059743 TaxID=3346928 RepID=UPI0036560018